MTILAALPILARCVAYQAKAMIAPINIPPIWAALLIPEAKKPKAKLIASTVKSDLLSKMNL